MGAIRGILLVFVSVLLFLSFLSINLLGTFSSSLEYDNFQKESTIIFGDLFKEINISNYMQNNYNLIQMYCQNNSNSTFVSSEGGYTFDIPCNVAFQGEKAISDEIIKNLIHKTYYKEYNCKFFDCMKQSKTPFFLLSENSYEYVINKFYFSLIISIILSILLFLLIEKKTNMPILIGSLLIVSSLPFFKLESFLSLFFDKTLFKFLRIFFSQIYDTSLRILIIGIIFLISGIILKIFKIGFFISNLFSKFKKKEIVSSQIKIPVKKKSRSKSK